MERRGKFNDHPPFQWLVDTAMGDAPPEVSGAVMEHLKECPECRADYEWLVEVSELASRAPGVEPPEDVLIRAKNLYRKRMASKPTTTNILERIGGWIMSVFSPRRNRFAFAMLLLLVLSVATVASVFLTQHPGVAHAAEVEAVSGRVEALLPNGEWVVLQPGDTVPQDAVIVADADANAVIVLPNGAKAVISGGSVVYLNKSSSKGSVEIAAADGNVQVSVDKAKGDISVETPGGTVHVTKTVSMSVTVEDDRIAVVRVMSGTVQVKTPKHEMTVTHGHVVTVEVPANAKGVLPAEIVSKIKERVRHGKGTLHPKREASVTPTRPAVTGTRGAKAKITKPAGTMAHATPHARTPSPKHTPGTLMPVPMMKHTPRVTMPVPTMKHTPNATRWPTPKHTPHPHVTITPPVTPVPPSMPTMPHPTMPFGHGGEGGHSNHK